MNRKQLLSEIMQADERDGLYEPPIVFDLTDEEMEMVNRIRDVMGRYFDWLTVVKMIKEVQSINLEVVDQEAERNDAYDYFDLNSEQGVQVSDTTEDDSSNADGNKK